MADKFRALLVSKDGDQQSVVITELAETELMDGNGNVTVDTVFTLSTRIVGGPRRATGNGSRTDWLMVKPGGEPFERFFVLKGLMAA